MGACNLPAHPARPELAKDAVPEVHCDYAFFRDKRGDMEKTRTVLVVVDRKSGGLSANVVPKKGGGAASQLSRCTEISANLGTDTKCFCVATESRLSRVYLRR